MLDHLSWMIKEKRVISWEGDMCLEKGKEAKEDWRKPEAEWAKLNVDASFSEADNTGLWGAILRDDEGKVIMSSWGMLTYCVSAEYAEALAILEGIKSIVNLDASQIHMESDCAAIVQDMKGQIKAKLQPLI